MSLWPMIVGFFAQKRHDTKAHAIANSISATLKAEGMSAKPDPHRKSPSGFPHHQPEISRWRTSRNQSI